MQRQKISLWSTINISVNQVSTLNLMIEPKFNLFSKSIFFSFTRLDNHKKFTKTSNYKTQIQSAELAVALPFYSNKNRKHCFAYLI